MKTIVMCVNFRPFSDSPSCAQRGSRELADWVESDDPQPPDPRETFRKVSHIALCMSYDMIDKLRWLEKETLKLPDEEIDKRLQHMSQFLDQLKTAYVSFAEIDF